MIQTILTRYAEEASFLWILRDAAVCRPDYLLEELAELDERIEAHLDGLRDSGLQGWKICKKALKDIGEVGEVFAAGVLAFGSGREKRVSLVIKIGTASPEVARALVSALGWVQRGQAAPHILTLLKSELPIARRAGIAAAAIQRWDPPDSLLSHALADADLAVRARALRAAGELGRVDLVPFMRQSFKHEDPACRLWAAWSAALLARDKDALQTLRMQSLAKGPVRVRAVEMVMRADDALVCHRLLQRLMETPETRPVAVAAAGALGDAGAVPWLIEQMAVPALARRAGEAFSTITGADLVYEKMEGAQPEGFEAGPTENPEDENVELDPDENLPWPDPALVQKWWDKHKTGFARGTRYLLGKPISDESLRVALRQGKQRQRAAAALELALRHPEKGLFEVRAPAWRQLQLLG